MQAKEDFHIMSAYAILINLDDNEVLYAKNSDEEMYPASMTKVMTVYTALDYIDNLDEQITITNEMLSGLVEENASVAGFSAQETVTMRDLLYGALLPSGADACQALAFYVAGSEEAFAEVMNQKLLEMNLTKTHFTNATGLHDDMHYTTAKEMAEIVKAAIQNDTFYEVFTAKEYTTQPTSQHPNGIEFTSSLRKSEKSFGLSDDIITGAKTGYTLEGGLCLASIGYHDNAHYLLVTGYAGGDSSIPMHIIDAHTIYEKMYKTYDYQKVWEKDKEIDDLHVKYNLFHRKIEVSLEEDIYALINKSYDINQINVSFDGETTLEAPIEKGQLLGNIVVSFQGEVIKQLPFYAPDDIGRNMILYGIGMVIDFLVSIRYILLTIVILFIIWVCYRRYKIRKRRKKRNQKRRTS